MSFSHAAGSVPQGIKLCSQPYPRLLMRLLGKILQQPAIQTKDPPLPEATRAHAGGLPPIPRGALD